MLRLRMAKAGERKRYENAEERRDTQKNNFLGKKCAS